MQSRADDTGAKCSSTNRHDYELLEDAKLTIFSDDHVYLHTIFRINIILP